jgi:four helix bundle protein
MNDEKNNKYDLEERTYQFAKQTCEYVKGIKKLFTNMEYLKQLLDASSSVGANYIEANEALSKKDFKMRIKICRKESKESSYWLRLIVETNDDQYEKEGKRLLQEAVELKKIFSAILLKS